MREKRKSEIESIVMNSATYNGITIHPTLINFFYGNNGVGKTTIARHIEENLGINWTSGKSNADYSVLIYNQDFITSNLQNYGKLPGVFTINEINISIQNEIEEKNKDKRKLSEDLTKLNEIKTNKEGSLGKQLELFQDSCWEKTKKIRERFEKTQGGKKRKAAFADEVLLIKNHIEHDIKDMEMLYDTAYDSNAKIYDEFNKVNNSLPICDLLNESITSKSETTFAKFMKVLNATDWVQQGHKKFSVQAEGNCPYCQQVLPEDFEDQLASCFDAQYQEDVERLNNFAAEYNFKAMSIMKALKNNMINLYPKLGLDGYKDKMALIDETLKLNEQLIEKKIKEPATKVDLTDVNSLIDDINNLIDSLNRQIKSNNDVVNAKQQKQTELKQQIWEHIAFLLKSDISSYNTSKKNLEKEIRDTTKQIGDFQKNSTELCNEISRLSSGVVNTKDTVDNINLLLRDSGFQGFNLKEKDDTPNVYEVIRPDGSVAEKLSEGERNFIAFLYFYHLVKGSKSADNTETEKIVVIDDPVSSMDSSALFIVSALVREMIEICHNNVDYLGNTGNGDYIKQLFILTHNTYFHREVTYNQTKHYDYISFFLIEKIDNISSITHCTRPCATAPSEVENYNPVQNAYAALWSEYREVKSTIPTLNVIRRILEYYFLQLCGYESTDIRKRLLVDNRDKFITTLEDGTQDLSKLNMASAMLYYIASSSKGVGDGLNYVDNAADVEQCKETFKMVFELMGQEQHYEMMMGINLEKLSLAL